MTVIQRFFVFSDLFLPVLALQPVILESGLWPSNQKKGDSVHETESAP